MKTVHLNCFFRENHQSIVEEIVPMNKQGYNLTNRMSGGSYGKNRIIDHRYAGSHVFISR